jgi:hypothetical protein
MPCVYEFWPSADMSVPETQLNQGFANRALPVMYLSTANSGNTMKPRSPDHAAMIYMFCSDVLTERPRLAIHQFGMKGC